MAQIPAKPQAVIAERWLPYSQQKRRVIYQAAPAPPVYCKTNNVIIQWNPPNVVVKQEGFYLIILNLLNRKTKILY